MAASNSSNGAGKNSVHALKKMECLVCSHVVSPPVLQCKNWHLVCNNCRQQRKMCPGPDCGEDLGSACRSGVAENYLEKYVLRCKYFYEGTKCWECTLKDDIELMLAHEAICHFREVKCLVPGCYKRVQLTLLLDHFEKEHAMQTNLTSEVHLNASQLIMNKLMVAEIIGDKSWKSFPAYALLDGNIFLIVFRLTSLRSPLFEISTVVHGYYPKEQKPFVCKITACNDSDPSLNAHYKWEGPIEQQYSLAPFLTWANDSCKLKWIVNIKISEFSGIRHDN